MKKSLILSKMHQYGYSKRSVFRARSEFAVETEKFQQLLEYFVGLEFLIFFLQGISDIFSFIFDTVCSC